MEKERKNSTLKQTYYRSFLWLVVIPLVLVPCQNILAGVAAGAVKE